MDSTMLEKLKQWMIENLGMKGNGQGQSQQSGSPWQGMPMGEDQNPPMPGQTPNAQLVQQSMRNAFNYPK